MKIRHLLIKNFRGIKELDWKITGDFICLIGPGDSTKSTILDAIEYVLSPRWNIPFEDTDFFNLDVSQKFEINATIGQLPNEFLSEQKYGLRLRGWNPQTGLNDEPKDGDEPVLTISLQVSKDLEPKWLIINDRLLEEKEISKTDRTMLGMSRLGVYTNRHLSWSQGSVLSTITGEEFKLNHILAEAARKIRDEIDLSSFEDITKAVSEAERLGKSLGVEPKDKIKAHVDIKRFTIKESGVSLHDGIVPIRLSGSGTQRLMGLALQLGLIEKGGINLIDEVEFGLEPHRIAQVLALLEKNMHGKGQVFLTTHSSSVLQELNIDNLKIVSSANGVTTVQEFHDDAMGSFQKLVRNSPYAFLANKIIVCEGKTEQGVLRGIDNFWQKKERGIWSYGSVSICGGGDASFNVAKQFNGLNYKTLWWGDSDKESLKASKEELSKMGIPVVEWGGNSNIEQRLFFDLPWEGIKELISLAVELYGQQSIVSQVKTSYTSASDDINKWVENQDLKTALATAAHKKEWFKDITKGEKVGDIVAKYWNDIADKDLAKKIQTIRGWVETGEHRGTTTS